jgi:hypothetical protein
MSHTIWIVIVAIETLLLVYVAAVWLIEVLNFAQDFLR